MKDPAKLKEVSDRAADLRAHDTDPNVVAHRVERIRGWVDRLVWVGIVLGLVFTASNVARFAADTTHADKYSQQWFTAWLLDPMVSLVLIGVLMGEQIVNRYGIKAGGWVRVTKWVALGCTYGMNTWQAWGSQNAAEILLHSVPPVIVVCATEAVPTLRRQITEAVTMAYETASDSTATAAFEAASESAASAAVEPLTNPVADPATIRFERTPRLSADLAEERSSNAPGQRLQTRSAQRSGERPKARPNAGARVPDSARKPASEPSPRAASDEELRARLDALITSGQVAVDPSVRAVQTALGIGWTRAKRVAEMSADEPIPGQLTVLDAATEADDNEGQDHGDAAA